MYIDGVSKLKLIFGPLNIYKLKMFSKSCNLVFFCFFFYLGKILQIFLVVFFLRINVKSSSFSNVFMELNSNLGCLSLIFVVHEFQSFSIGIVSFEVLVQTFDEIINHQDVQVLANEVQDEPISNSVKPGKGSGFQDGFNITSFN